MLICDYFRSERDRTWDYALQCGVNHGVIRLPETPDFDVTDESHFRSVIDGFKNFGITPVIIEPLPNCLHDHIKAGDSLRDKCIEDFIKMMSLMDKFDVRTVCFNFMAYVGWTRTKNDILERGNACVTGFDINDYVPTKDKITEKQLWDNYTYFIKAAVPYAEKYNIKLALHPDDPPLLKLGDVERIMISYKNIDHAVNGIVKSDALGVTMCQATYKMMGEDLNEVIPKFADKIFFVHFRNAIGDKYKFRETFHDNGDIDMAEILRLYKKCNVDVPIRVDHVPTMAGEDEKTGYSALGRLYAIGYLKGLCEAID